MTPSQVICIKPQVRLGEPQRRLNRRSSERWLKA